MAVILSTVVRRVWQERTSLFERSFAEDPFVGQYEADKTVTREGGLYRSKES
jgi:hypothetical protein